MIDKLTELLAKDSIRLISIAIPILGGIIGIIYKLIKIIISIQEKRPYMNIGECRMYSSHHSSIENINKINWDNPPVYWKTNESDKQYKFPYHLIAYDIDSKSNLTFETKPLLKSVLLQLLKNKGLDKINYRIMKNFNSQTVIKNTGKSTAKHLAVKVFKIEETKSVTDRNTDPSIVGMLTPFSSTTDC